jgi:hypothetical protein
VQIVDRFGTTYAVKRWPLSDDSTVYYVLSLAGDAVVARAVLQVVRGCVTEVLVYNQTNRRRGIASALYRLIEADLGRPLVPSRIRSRAGLAFWASRSRVPYASFTKRRARGTC